MRTDEFEFELPDDRIALEPVSPRSAARLLYAPARAKLEDRRVADLPSLLKQGDLLVVNDTRVISAALSGIRLARDEVGQGARIEVLLHKRVDAQRWTAFARPMKRLKVGDRIRFTANCEAHIEERGEQEVTLRFKIAGPDLDIAIEEIGAPPLPPYISAKRGARPSDKRDYQTIFAKKTGAVAAPTAGLHFELELLDALRKRGIEMVQITLHVGAGTFLPMKALDTRDHHMHSEWREIDAQTAQKINQAKSEGRRVIAVGTTALRALESAAGQSSRIEPQSGETDIFITPGYQFKIVDALWTNFHLPRSTLFALVAAFVGLERAHAAYRHAIEGDYRFYSFGDACLFERETR